jgi:hypothetical protein
MDQTVCEIFEAPKLSLNPALFLQPWVIFYLVVDSKLVFQVKMQQFEQKKILTHRHSWWPTLGGSILGHYSSPFGGKRTPDLDLAGAKYGVNIPGFGGAAFFTQKLCKCEQFAPHPPLTPTSAPSPEWDVPLFGRVVPRLSSEENLFMTGTSIRRVESKVPSENRDQSLEPHAHATKHKYPTTATTTDLRTLGLWCFGAWPCAAAARATAIECINLGRSNTNQCDSKI